LRHGLCINQPSSNSTKTIIYKQGFGSNKCLSDPRNIGTVYYRRTKYKIE
jgi:hypothetical protein